MKSLRILSGFVLASLITSSAHAQALSFQRDDIPAASGARGITSADLNRDGWVDVITAHHDPDGLSIHLNRGRSGGYATTFIPLPGGPFDVVTGDLNKDGSPDIAVANPDANVINVLFGNGDGTFRGPMNVGARFNPRALTIADMDRDSNPDIVFTEFYNSSVTIYWGDGVQSFIHRQPGSLAVGANPQGVAVADFNVDGWPDLVVAGSTSVGLTLLYHTPGANTFSRQDLDVPTQQNVVAVGDFDHDGRPDIAAASTTTTDVTVVLNRRGGMATQVYPSGGSSPRGIVAVDLNRDGRLDLVAGTRGTSTVQVLLGHADGTFAAAVGYAAGAGSRAVTAADFNNDGRMDLASGNEYASSMTVLSNTTELQRAGFGYRRHVLGPAIGNSSSGNANDVADFDRDGRLDAVFNANGMGVRFANGRATGPLATFGVTDLAAVNVNGDGAADIVALSEGLSGGTYSSIETFIGDGSGNFPGRRNTPTGLLGHEMEVADFNLDGLVDMIISGQTQPSGPWSVRVFGGNGDGTFTLRAVIAPAELPFTITIGDVDRDGDPDVVTTGRATTSEPVRVITRLNEGGWRFGTPLGTPVAELGISDGALGDLNHDGFLDFIGVGSAPDWRSRTRAAVLLGGPAGFAPPTYLTANEFVLGISIADLDVDGHADLMTDNGTFFKGAGDGTFATAELFDFYGPDTQIADFNRDGLPDLIGAHEHEQAQILVLLNRTGTDNGAPTVNLGPDFKFEYREFYGEGDARELWARATDPDVHKMTFKWHLPGGRVEESGTFPFWGVPLSEPGSYEITVEANDGRGAVGFDTVAYTITPEKEVVLHVGMAPWDTEQVGNWQIVSDASAASGKAARDINVGAPKVTSPSPAPPSYIDVGFVADTTQTYKLWVRLKADGNSWANDSVWLQFTNAVDSSGRSIAPGTASGIEVNLEECSGCGVSGWGWRDEAWGQRDMIGTLTIRFTKSGWQRVRIQTREDGASVDQIVLSSETYRTTRPGAVKNDATILSPRAYW